MFVCVFIFWCEGVCEFMFLEKSLFDLLSQMQVKNLRFSSLFFSLIEKFLGIKDD